MTSEQASILDTRTVAIGDVVPHPDNARRGNLQRIEKSLRDHGQFRPIVVHEETGYILAGNHTHRAATKLGWAHIEATYVRCSEAKARAILAVDNRSADGADYDDEALLALLESLDSDDLLGEAGYETIDLDDLVAKLEEHVDEQGRADDDIPAARSLDDKAADYRDQPTRMIVLNYPIARFTWMIEQLGALGEKLELESNAEVLLHLVEQETGTPAPKE